LIVPTHTGDIEVLLRVPHRALPIEYGPQYDVLADLFQLGQDADGGELDREACAPLEDELLRRFMPSPEGKTLAGHDACHFVMDFAASYFGATIATLEPEELEEIVFEIIPQKVSIPASAASSIIEEARAFYAFLKREFGLKQADSCLAVLGGNAVKELKTALSDSSNFGMAKSVFMGGRDAGFDMETREGVEAWMQAMHSMQLPGSVGLPSLSAPGRPLDKAAPTREEKSTQGCPQGAQEKPVVLYSDSSRNRRRSRLSSLGNRDVRNREIGAAIAAPDFDEDLGLEQVPEWHARGLPRIEVLGDGYRAALASGLPNAVILCPARDVAP
jgi:hypothetical protein